MNNPIAHKIRSMVFNIIKKYRSTDLCVDKIPGPRFMEYLHCSECRERITCRPLNVNPETEGFVCKKCIKQDSKHLLVIIPQSYLADLRLPCKWARYGCCEHPSFGEMWTIHSEMCRYGNVLIDGFLDES